MFIYIVNEMWMDVLLFILQFICIGFSSMIVWIKFAVGKMLLSIFDCADMRPMVNFVN